MWRGVMRRLRLLLLLMLVGVGVLGAGAGVRGSQYHGDKGGGAEVKSIHVIAERHTASRHFVTLMRVAFDVTVHDSFCAFKHWLQNGIHSRLARHGSDHAIALPGDPTAQLVERWDTPFEFPDFGEEPLERLDARIPKNRRQGCPNNNPPAYNGRRATDVTVAQCRDPSNVMVIAVFRNPYDWLNSMHRQAHHAPSHERLGPSQFISKRWEPTKAIWMTYNQDHACSSNFVKGEMLPCWKASQFAPLCRKERLSQTACNGGGPMYELDFRGDVFDNILKMRAYKIRDFLMVQKWVPHFEAVRYEDWMSVDYQTQWMEHVAKKHGLKFCSMRAGDYLNQWHRDRAKSAAEASFYMRRIGRVQQGPPLRNMFNEADLLEQANGNIDWDAEALIGYRKVTN